MRTIHDLCGWLCARIAGPQLYSDSKLCARNAARADELVQQVRLRPGLPGSISIH
jgi:hypothetical protein